MLCGEVFVMSLGFSSRSELHAGVEPVDQHVAPAAIKPLMEVAEVVLDMRGQAPYPGHPYSFSGNRAVAPRVRAVEAMIDQHWYEQNPNARRTWRMRRRNEPVRLGAETQAEAMRLAVGRHFVAVETGEFENPILAYGYAPGAHRLSPKSAFHIAELATSPGVGQPERAQRAICAAAAIVNHVIVTHSVHGVHPRKRGQAIGAHMPGIFSAEDNHTIALAGGFDTADIAPMGGLSLYAHDSSRVSRHLTAQFGLAATRSVTLAQNS